MSDSEFQSPIIEESSDADFQFIENLGREHLALLTNFSGDRMKECVSV